MVLGPQATLSAADLGLAISHECGDQRVLGEFELRYERAVGGAAIGNLELQNFGVTVKEGCHGGDPAADEAQNTVRGCGARREGDIDACTTQQTEKRKAMQHGHRLGGAVRLCEQARQDVGVVLTGERNDHLVTTDIGFVE